MKVRNIKTDKMKYPIVLCILLLFTACQEGAKNTLLEEEKSEISGLKSKLLVLEKEKDSLQLLVSSNLDTKKETWFGTMESKSIKDLGIEDPIKYITEALENNPKVIPTDGVLGGTMFFTDIEILGSKWIVASYEDGHIMGRGIFTYKIDPETLEVKFDVLDKMMDY